MLDRREGRRDFKECQNVKNNLFQGARSVAQQRFRQLIVGKRENRDYERARKSHWKVEKEKRSKKNASFNCNKTLEHWGGSSHKPAVLSTGTGGGENDASKQPPEWILEAISSRAKHRVVPKRKIRWARKGSQRIALG